MTDDGFLRGWPGRLVAGRVGSGTHTTATPSTDLPCSHGSSLLGKHSCWAGP